MVNSCQFEIWVKQIAEDIMNAFHNRLCKRKTTENGVSSLPRITKFFEVKGGHVPYLPKLKLGAALRLSLNNMCQKTDYKTVEKIPLCIICS